ncbi:hypothetical protein N7488_012471 [Penicillium malachiteum]|nr:hypothetical protein N7488_012471 [Penicillium malachiteum]
MDFVPTPPSSTVPPVEIPVLPNAPYQIPGPHDLHRFLQQESADEDENSLSAIEIATLVQSRLFMGLLSVLLGTTPNLEKISVLKTINGETRRYFRLESIGTTPFSVYKHFRLWLLRNTLFEDLKKVRGRLDSLERLPNGKFSPVPEIALSTRVLVDTLVLVTRAGLLVWGSKEKGPYFEALQPCPYNQDDTLPSLSLLFSRLKSSGLCPSRCISYSQKMTHLQLYYMSGITHHFRGLDHNQCSNLECTASSRQGHPVDKPRHYVDGCDCSLQFASDDLVSSILARGKIPLVRITRCPESSRENGSRLSISIEPAKISSQYYAISHVWSDGMGNAGQNSVYYCWLQLIFEKLSWNTRNSMTRSTWELSELPLSILKKPSESSIDNEESYLFWLDILCIPAKAKGQEDLRRQAIERIPVVFSGARKVLIFDSEMMRSRLGASKPVEVIGRFLGCNWPTRGWTYQEGAHSFPAMIQLSDCAMNARSLEHLHWDWQDFMRPRSLSLSWTTKIRFINKQYHLVQISLQTMIEKSVFAAFLREMRAWFPQEFLVLAYVGSHDYPFQDEVGHRGALAFVECWNQLLSRSSSDENDKLTILAMAMNLSLYQVMQIPLHKRFASMIWSLSEIPLDFLVIPPAQSTEAPEVRTSRSMRNLWVPEYFNGSSINPVPTILAKVQSHFGCFSKDREKLYISLSTVPGGRHMAITIPEPLEKLPWLRLQHFDQSYVVQFHRAADNTLDFSQYSGAVFMVDLHPSQAKPATEGETWMPGCCLLVKDQSTMEVIYDSAISVLKVKDCQEPHSYTVQNYKQSWPSVASITVNSCIGRPPLLSIIKSQYRTTPLMTLLRDTWRICSPIGIKKDDIVLTLLCGKSTAF